MQQLPDNQLLLLSAQSNKLAFECFYARHQQRIYHTALHKCHDPQLAEQLVQDVFVKLYLRLIDSKNPCKYQISYLYTMLETLHIDHIRGYHNKNTISIDDDMHNDLELINNNGNDYPDKCAEQADITTIIMTPLRKAEKLVKQAKVQSEKHFAQHRKEKVEKDVNNAIETFNQLYHYGYSLQEMATNLGLTLEQVKYREKKLLNIIKAGLSPHYPHFNTKRVNLLSYQ